MGNKGHAYEEKIWNILEDAKLIHPDFPHKTGSKHHPDAVLQYDYNPLKIEVKLNISAVKFGQIDFKYERGWVLPSKTDNPEFREALKSTGILQFLNSNWKEKPKYFNLKHGEKATPELMEEEQKNFPVLRWVCPQNLIDTYYRNKGISYIQVGGFGFYKIQGGEGRIRKQIPLLTPKIEMEIRVKSSGMKNGGQYYSFNAATKAFSTGLNKSKFDLEKDVSFLFEKFR
jgi:hypothetical protein